MASCRVIPPPCDIQQPGQRVINPSHPVSSRSAKQSTNPTVPNRRLSTNAQLQYSTTHCITSILFRPPSPPCLPPPTPAVRAHIIHIPFVARCTATTQVPTIDGAAATGIEVEGESSYSRARGNTAVQNGVADQKQKQTLARSSWRAGGLYDADRSLGLSRRCLYKQRSRDLSYAVLSQPKESASSRGGQTKERLKRAKNGHDTKCPVTEPPNIY